MLRQLNTLLLLAVLTGCTDDKVEKVSVDAPHIDPVEQLSQLCFSQWEGQSWTLGESGSIAQQNTQFRAGVQKVCQARAELYAEGYEIYPFIADNTQREVYAMVFSADIESIKSHLKVYLPKLRVI